MIFGIHPYKKFLCLVTALSVFVPLYVFASPNTERLTDAKNQLNEVWNAAQETAKQRSELEEHLAHFDEKVASAKRELEQATTDRLAIDDSIHYTKARITALRQHIDTATASRLAYQKLAKEREDHIVFVKHIAAKEFAESSFSESPLTRNLFEISFADSVEMSMDTLALRTTSQPLSGHVSFLLAEADRATIRLQALLGSLEAELVLLQNKRKKLGDTVSEKAMFIDDSWRQKKLTQEELQSVMRETAETNANIASMRESLIKINEELQETELKKLQAELTDLHAKKQALEDMKSASLEKVASIRALEEEVAEAWKATFVTRNSDKKLYKRIEEEKLHLQNLQAEHALLVRMSSGSGVPVPKSEVLLQKITFLLEEIALMEGGVTKEEATTYLQKKARAEAANMTGKDLPSHLENLAKQTEALQVLITAKLKAINAVDAAIDFQDLPPVFTWPVKGTITAGYFDADYAKIFKVPHRAIDIAVRQGTAIHVVSDGIVFAVKDGGLTGYSYILVGHRNGYASLYGHVSKSLVRAGDAVAHGQVIGFTGGQPGTQGAGSMTTGAHLHLEMLRNGEHINPLDILPKQ